MVKNKKWKFIILAALSIALAAGVGTAGARYDELILPDKDEPQEQETTAAVIGETVYRVKEGDTLWKVANTYGLSVKKLMTANGITFEKGLIQVGQSLRIPGTAAVTYTVRPGETLSEIAAHYKVKTSDLMSKNRLADADFVREGQRLVITGSNLPVSESLPALSRLAGNLARPAEGYISSYFGLRDGRPHQGLDIAADQGRLIHAAKKGQVIFAGPRGTYGLAVIIDHGGQLETLYAHCSKLLVSPGDRVQQGQPIAEVGSTGRSTGPHLHFEVIWQGTHYDPLPFLENYYC